MRESVNLRVFTFIYIVLRTSSAGTRRRQIDMILRSNLDDFRQDLQCLI